jgi:hypothetical protein
MKASRVISLAVLALALLPPLAIYLYTVALALVHQPKPVKTGDALLDTYLQTTVDNGEYFDRLRVTVRNYADLDVRRIRKSQWREWEQKYGGDPNFWMLCFYLRDKPGADVWPDDQAHLPDRYRYLEEARRRGAADWKVLYQLYTGHRKEWSKDAQLALGLATPNWWPGLSRSVLTNFHRTINREMERRHGPEHRRLLQELLAAGGGQAQVHYMLARFANDCGDDATALKELEAGNRAPACDSAAGFPQAAIWRISSKGAYIGGDKMLDWFSAWTFSLDERSVVEGIVKGSTLAATQTELAKQGADLHRSEMLYLYLCRMAVNEPPNRISLSSYKDALSTLAQSMQSYDPARATKLQNEMMRLSSNLPTNNWAGFGFGPRSKLSELLSNAEEAVTSSDMLTIRDTLTLSGRNMEASKSMTADEDLLRTLAAFDVWR